MKKILPFIFLCFSFSGFAQVNYIMPEEANTFYKNAMLKIKPDIKNIVIKNAQSLKGQHVNTDSLFTQLHKEPALKSGSKANLQAIVVLIMVQVSKNADADLKNLVINMSKNKNPNKSNESPEDQVATIVANKSVIAESVTMAMKKFSDSGELQLDNLK
jgi:hypothetical protein